MGIPLWKPKDEIKQIHHTQSPTHSNDYQNLDILTFQQRPTMVSRHSSSNSSTSSANSIGSSSIANAIALANANGALGSGGVSVSVNSSAGGGISSSRPRHTHRISPLDSSGGSNRSRRSTPISRPTFQPRRTELDRQIAIRMSEKEDLLAQLEVTVSLLDQFLSARSALGSEVMAIPTFITQDLPALLASAASVSVSPPRDITFANSYQGVLDRVMQISPYSSLLPQLESSIASAHRRIRDQLALLGTTIPSISPDNLLPLDSATSTTSTSTSTFTSTPNPTTTITNRNNNNNNNNSHNRSIYYFE
ncbi:hypothetical protein F4703DRAFT_1572924 [Phycomyces blakesleeanus]